MKDYDPSLARRVRRQKLCAAVAGFAIVVVSLADFWVAIRNDAPLVSEHAMANAKARLTALARPGDWVVHSPLFGMQELSVLGGLRARPDVPAAHARAGRRVVVLDRKDYPMYGLGSGERRLPLSEGLVLRIFEPRGLRGPVRYELGSGISRHTMHIDFGSQRSTVFCNQARRGGGFGCPGMPEWLYVQERMLVVGGVPGPCVWSHPTARGVVIHRIPAQRPHPDGGPLRLRLMGALTDDAARNTPAGADVFTAVFQQGRKLGELKTPNRVGWNRMEVSIDADIPLELRTRTKRDERRHYCVRLTIVEEARSAPSKTRGQP